jgi:hypothetical protein
MAKTTSSMLYRVLIDGEALAKQSSKVAHYSVIISSVIRSDVSNFLLNAIVNNSLEEERGTLSTSIARL